MKPVWMAVMEDQGYRRLLVRRKWIEKDGEMSRSMLKEGSTTACIIDLVSATSYVCKYYVYGSSPSNDLATHRSSLPLPRRDSGAQLPWLAFPVGS